MVSELLVILLYWAGTELIQHKVTAWENGKKNLNRSGLRLTTHVTICSYHPHPLTLIYTNFERIIECRNWTRWSFLIRVKKKNSMISISCSHFDSVYNVNNCCVSFFYKTTPSVCDRGEPDSVWYHTTLIQTEHTFYLLVVVNDSMSQKSSEKNEKSWSPKTMLILSSNFTGKNIDRFLDPAGEGRASPASRPSRWSPTTPSRGWSKIWLKVS